MYGVNEDAYWDAYQRRWDKQWHDEEYDGDEFSENRSEWDEADARVDEILLERARRV